MVELAEKLPVRRGRSLLGSPPRDLILRVRGGQHGGYVVRLSDLKCTIGSHERCTFRLRAAGVRPWHCLVFRGSQATFVRRIDENTRLNGRNFDMAKLSAGDRLTIGPVELEVIDEEVAHRQTVTSSTAALPRYWHDPAASVRAAADQAGRQARQLKDALAKTRHAATQRVRHLTEQLRSARRQIQQLHEESERAHEKSAAEHEAVARQHELLAGEFEQQKSELEADLQRRAQQLEARSIELLQQQQEFATRRAAAEQEFDARQQELDEQRDQIRMEQSRAQQEISESRHLLDSSSEQRESQLQQLEQARADWQRQRRREQERLLEQAEQLNKRQAELAENEAELEEARAELENLRAELEQLRVTRSESPPPPPDIDPVVPAAGADVTTSTDETAQVVEATLRSLIGDPAPSGDTLPTNESDAATTREDTGGVLAEGGGPSRQPSPPSETVSDVLARLGRNVDCHGHDDQPILPTAATEQTAYPAPATPQTITESPPPPAVLEQPSEPAQSSDDGEESVEEYMARLMQRLRGGDGPTQDPVPSTFVDSTPEVPAPEPQPDVSAEDQTASEVVELPAPAKEPIQPSEYKPRNQAPERGTDLNVLRDLANSSARSAISTHKGKADGKAAMAKSIAAGLALFGATAFALLLGLGSAIGLAGTGIALVLGMIWGVQAFVLSWRARNARRIIKNIGTEQDPESDGAVEKAVYEQQAG